MITPKLGYLGQPQKLFAEQRATAENRYRTIVAQFPDHAQNDRQKREIREYCADVLGSPIYTAELLAFAAAHGAFLEGWIPASYYYTVLLPRWKNHALIGAKTISRRFLDPDLIPDVAYHVRGCWLDSDLNPVEPAALKEILFGGYDHVYVKSDMGALGINVHRVKQQDFEPEKLCPSSYKMGHQSGLSFGGPGSFV